MSFSWRLIGFASAYWAGAELSYLLLEKAGNFSAFWPPAGIYLGMLLATPRRRWGAVVLAAVVPNLLADIVVHGQPVRHSAGFLLVNVGAPLAAAALLVRLCRPAFSFARLAHVMRWVLVSAFAGTPLGALGGAALVVNAHGGVFAQKWFLWWVGDLLGVLALTPFAYEWLGRQTLPQRTRLLEALVLLLSLSAATVFIFRLPDAHALPPVVLFFFLLWAALRFGAALVSATVTVLAVIALWLTGAGFGPYTIQALPHTRALMVQVMAATGALMFYILAAVMAERRAAESELQQSNARLDEQVNARTAELLTANERLRAGETSLQLALDASQAGTWAWDAAAGFSDWDERYQAQYGFDALAPRSFETWMSAVHPDDRPQLNERIAAMLAAPDDDVWRQEFRALHPTRGECWMLGLGRLERDANGRPLRLRGINLDITERKRAEQALRESEERFRNMADHAPVMVWVTEPDGNCTYLSQSWYEFTGQSPETGLSLGWLNAVHPDDREMAENIFAAANERREPFRLDYRLRRGDGAYRWAIDSAQPRFSAAGEFLGYIGSVIDITERKRMEEALREADRRKDEFLAMLAHELRNPLAPIRNAAQVLKLTGPANAEQQWTREVIERQTQHLTRLVDDLLDVSRITQGKITLQREPLEPATIIHRAVEASRPLIDARRHQLTVALPWAAAESPLVEGDLTRLVQVVSNLLNNAAKYTDEGGRIRLAVAQEDGEVVIRVRDNGLGLTADLAPRVFDLFTQADRSLDRSQGGLGIGLTLVKQLVEMHGGRVEAHSAGLNQGSEFIVRLPALRPAEGGARTEDGAVDPQSAFGNSHLRVLVIEDNVDSAQMMGFMLKLDGHETRLAYDGLTALGAARAFMPQVVVCDIGLPGMDGYEVARQLRAAPEFKQTRLIALSGYGRDEDRLRSKEAGFDYHLTKPVDPDALTALLDSLRPDARAA